MSTSGTSDPGSAAMLKKLKAKIVEQDAKIKELDAENKRLVSARSEAVALLSREFSFYRLILCCTVGICLPVCFRAMRSYFQSGKEEEEVGGLSRFCPKKHQSWSVGGKRFKKVKSGYAFRVTVNVLHVL